MRSWRIEAARYRISSAGFDKSSSLCATEAQTCAGAAWVQPWSEGTKECEELDSDSHRGDMKTCMAVEALLASWPLI